MYHPPSRLRTIVTRAAVSLLMTVTVITLVVVSIFYIQGYRFDDKDQKLEQSGLVQYISQPSGASVSVDGTLLAQKTPSNSTVTAGKHTFRYSRSGYLSWEKTVVVKPGTLTWLNYVRLIPEQLQTTSVAKFAGASAALASPDHRFLAVLPSAKQPNITVYDVSGNTVQTGQLTLKPSDYADAKTAGISHTFRLMEWSGNGQYLLVQHRYGKALEWLVFDRQDGVLVSNVTQTMAVNITAAHLVTNDGPGLLALIDNTVRKIDLSKDTVSKPLVSGVGDFSVYGNDTIGYVTLFDKTTHQQQVGIIKGDGAPVVLYASRKDSKRPLHVVSGHYFDKDYVAVSDGKKVMTYAGDFPRVQADATKLVFQTVFTFSKDIARLDFNPESRFIIAQTGNNFQTYDLERQETSPVLSLGTASAQELRWFDSYHLWANNNGMLTIEDFDGTNQHSLVSTTGNLDAILSPNGKYLYSIIHTTSGYELQRTLMILN